MSWLDSQQYGENQYKKKEQTKCLDKFHIIKIW